MIHKYPPLCQGSVGCRKQAARIRNCLQLDHLSSSAQGSEAFQAKLIAISVNLKRIVPIVAFFVSFPYIGYFPFTMHTFPFFYLGPYELFIFVHFFSGFKPSLMFYSYFGGACFEKQTLVV